MAETAQYLIDEIRSLNRRIARLEALVLPAPPSPPRAASPPIERKRYKLASFSVENVLFHYKDPGYAHMKQVLDELITSIHIKRHSRNVHIYAEFVTGRPDLSVDANELPSGFKILLLITPRNPSINENVYKTANYNAQDLFHTLVKKIHMQKLVNSKNYFE